MTLASQSGTDLERSALAPPLKGLRVLVLLSGHDACDHRVYGKEARSFIDMGAEVTVVGRCKQSRPEKVTLMEVPAPRSRFGRFFIQPWRCLWRARSLRPDIVHFHDAEVLFTLPVARLLWRRTKFIYDVHEDFPQLMKVRDWIPRPFRSLVAWGLARMEKCFARLAHGIVGVTDPLTARFGNAHRTTARNFITRDYFDLAMRHSRPMREREYDIVHLGTLRRSRGDFLAEVLRAVHRRRPLARSLVVGCEPDIRDRLLTQIPAGCDVLESVPHCRVPELLGNARIGLDVHPWREPHLDVALPVKVCEYLASGCAVVCSSMPVLEALCAQSGIRMSAMKILDSRNPEEYAQECVSLLSPKQHLEDARYEHREFAQQRLHWDREAERIVALYLDVLGARPVAS